MRHMTTNRLPPTIAEPMTSEQDSDRSKSSLNRHDPAGHIADTT